jgi:hypothetical protein
MLFFVFIVFFVLLLGTETAAFVAAVIAASVLAIGVVWWFSKPYVEDEPSAGGDGRKS